LTGSRFIIILRDRSRATKKEPTMTTLAIAKLEESVRLTWRVRRNNGELSRWFKTRVDVPASLEEAKQAFLKNGHTFTEETVFETGRWVPCPRCSGTGNYGGGKCFKCWGSEPLTWKPVK
jgi:hypothetical protein